MYQDSKRTCTAIVLLIKPFAWCCSRRRCNRGLLKLPIFASATPAQDPPTTRDELEVHVIFSLPSLFLHFFLLHNCGSVYLVPVTHVLIYLLRRSLY